MPVGAGGRWRCAPRDDVVVLARFERHDEVDRARAALAAGRFPPGWVRVRVVARPAALRRYEFGVRRRGVEAAFLLLLTAGLLDVPARPDCRTLPRRTRVRTGAVARPDRASREQPPPPRPPRGTSAAVAALLTALALVASATFAALTPDRDRLEARQEPPTAQDVISVG